MDAFPPPPGPPDEAVPTQPESYQGQDHADPAAQHTYPHQNGVETTTDALPQGWGAAAAQDGAPQGPDGEQALPGPPPADALPPPPSMSRRNRWGPPADAQQSDSQTGKRKKRSRWEEAENPSTAIVVAAPAGTMIGSFTFPKEVAICGGALRVVLPSTLTGELGSSDPKVRALHAQLKDLDRRIENNILDIPPEGQRSPSPEPVYDRMGVRLNTREIRAKEKLLDQRLKVIEDLIKDDPNFKPPADYRPRKYSVKIRIPQEEYPHHNFIGLIIGPRGNTQKRMQQETNTKIAIRGRGSVKEGANKFDYGEDEELHVLITGNSQQDVDRAKAMIELLMSPDDETMSEHKKLQLRELAALNGTLKDEVACTVCGEATHRSWECPKEKQQLFVLPDAIKAKVEEQYARDVARVRGAGAIAPEDDYNAFLRELGGNPPPELMGEGGPKRPGLGGHPGRGGVPDECKLYVGSLPLSFNDKQLAAMFEPFGTVLLATVLYDNQTGQSRGFGFVHFEDAETARQAAQAMHGKPVEGRPLVVRVRSDPTPAPGAGGPRGPPPVHDNTNTLYVCAISPTVSDAVLRDLFERFGKVTDLRIITDKVTGVSKGYAFVTMSNQEEVAAAIRGGNGTQLDGRAIIVKKAGDRGPPGQFGGPRDDREGRILTAAGPYGGPPHRGPPPPYGHPYPGGPPPPHHYGGPPPPHYMPPPGPYGGPPPPGPYGPYGMPPPGAYDPYYGAGYYGAPMPGPYGAPPPGAYPGYPGYPPQGAPLPGQPPLPPGEDQQGSGYPGSEAAAAGSDPYGSAAAAAGGHPPPPPPNESGPPPPPPAPPQMQQAGGGQGSDYEKFMAELGRGL